jgi:hypothetical protein
MRELWTKLMLAVAGEGPSAKREGSLLCGRHDVGWKGRRDCVARGGFSLSVYSGQENKERNTIANDCEKNWEDEAH